MFCPPKRWMALIALAGFFAAVPAASLPADVVKNTKTGETLTGRLLDQYINKLRVFKTETGRTKFLDMKEWEIVERSEPAEPEPGGEKPDAPKPSADTGGGDKAEKAEEPASPCVYIIPITGEITHPCLVEGIERALEEAKKEHAEAVVFRLDTPGGLLQVTDKIIRLLEGVTWAPTVSWVSGGEQKGALSAGAYICMATKHIYMAPGTTIGAATPFRIGFFGSAEVDEKFKSAFRARFRSLAQQLGHPSVIADAMVDNKVSAVQVWITDEPKIVTREEADRLEKEHKDAGTFKRGKTIVRRGSLLTMTSKEAVTFGVAAGLADSRQSLLEHLDQADRRVVEASWMPEWVETTAEKRKKEVDQARTLFEHHFEQAMIADPHRGRYILSPSGRFLDHGRRWKNRTDRALQHLKTCAKAFQQLEKMAKDGRYGFRIEPREIDRMKLRVQAFYDRLRRERNVEAVP